MTPTTPNARGPGVKNFGPPATPHVHISFFLSLLGRISEIVLAGTVLPHVPAPLSRQYEPYRLSKQVGLDY